MNTNQRKIFIGGNWKSNNTLAETRNLVSNVINKITFNTERVEVLICPSTIHVNEVTNTVTNKDILVGAQNISKYDFGAYTGETSCRHLHDFGIQWTLVGHSERRTLFGEDNKSVAEKTRHAINNKVNVVLCIGETLNERESNQTLDVIQEQLKVVADELKETQYWNNIVIAYEPVWAIGTGKVASPEQAQDVHKFIRTWISDNLGQNFVNNMRIIYGGSVSEKNCKELIQQNDIDGFLIGGASLKQSFKDIIDIVNETL